MIIRLTMLSAFLAVAAVPVVAQHANAVSPVRPMPPPANALPFGNILFPGGIQQPSFAQRLGGTVSGSIPYTGVPPAMGVGRPGYGGRGIYGGHGGRGNTVVVPYAVPVYGGGYGYADYGYGYPGQQPPPNVTVVVPQQATPTVVINQGYTPQEDGDAVVRQYAPGDQQNSGIRVYEGAQDRSAAPESRQAAPKPNGTGSYVRDDQPTIFLIAMKDTTVRQAIGYWVDENVLHYVTPSGTINHVTMDVVDRDMSVRLNSERKLDFDLNAARKYR